MPEQPLRIAMWSGPRNISTALMRAWGNRPDTFVCDEPLYAHYLQVTGLEHPGREATLAHHESDWRKVVAWLTGPVPEGRSIFYQKQMTHHLLPEIDRDWLDALTHTFLIREPREMLTSLVKHIPQPHLSDTGLPQQLEIFRRVRERTGRTPPVIDAREVLDDPEGMLRALCNALEVEFSEQMLRWEPGLRETDGAWARWWYPEVQRTTGFRPYRPKGEPMPEHLAALLSPCQACYDELYQHRLTAR